MYMGNKTSSYVDVDAVRFSGLLIKDEFEHVPDNEPVTISITERGITITFDNYPRKFVGFDRLVDISSNHQYWMISYLHGIFGGDIRRLLIVADAIVDDLSYQKIVDMMQENGFLTETKK